LRISINLLPVLPETGAALVYPINLVRSLAKIDDHNRYYLLVTPKNKHLFEVGKSNFTQINNFNRLWRIVWEQCVVPILLKSYKIDVFHGLLNSLPFVILSKSVVTFNFMNIFTTPEAIPKSKRSYYRLSLKWSARKHSKIIAQIKMIHGFVLQHCAKFYKFWDKIQVDALTAK